MSKNNNTASMYREEYDTLSDSIIDSIKFVALESRLGRIKITDWCRTILEFNYNTNKNFIDIVYFYSGIFENPTRFVLNGNTKSVMDLINILRLLEEKNYTILS
jgi:hypothetical protein